MGNEERGMRFFTYIDVEMPNLSLGLGLVQTLNLYNSVYMYLKWGISTLMYVKNLIPHSPFPVLVTSIVDPDIAYFKWEDLGEKNEIGRDGFGAVCFTIFAENSTPHSALHTPHSHFPSHRAIVHLQTPDLFVLVCWILSKI